MRPLGRERVGLRRGMRSRHASVERRLAGVRGTDERKLSRSLDPKRDLWSAAGGRTGLTAVTVGILFLAAMFFAPLAGMVPAFATAGALLYVALLMMSGLEALDWGDATEVLPALLTAIMIPLTFSIANGIAVGFISYVTIKLLSGRGGEISAGAWFLTVVFVSKFVFI